jgi:hypothetical protein
MTQTAMILYGGLIACVVAAGVLYNYKSELFQSRLIPKAIDPRPILWFVLDDQANGRTWTTFADRNARANNRGYTELALQAAYKTQGAFRVEVLEGRDAVISKITSPIPAKYDQLPPKLWKGWSRAALLASQGGLYVDGDSVLFIGPCMMNCVKDHEAALFGINPDEPRVSATTAVAPGPSSYVGWARSAHQPAWDLAEQEWFAVVAPGAPSYTSAIAQRVDQEIMLHQREKGATVLREPEGSRRVDGTVMNPEDFWGRTKLPLDANVVYIAVDGEALERSTQLQWALRLSPTQLLESDLVWVKLAKHAMEV